MKKIYPNEPCPCGSGLKFKKCKCEEFHSKRSIQNIDVPEGLKVLKLQKFEEDTFLEIASFAREIYRAEKRIYGSSLKRVTPTIIKSDKLVAVGRYGTGGSQIIISSGFISRYHSLVEERFPDSIIEKFFKIEKGDSVRRKIFETIIKKTVLHEYYHWFRGHGFWGADHNPPIEGKATEEQRFLYNIKQQSIEYDADKYAINMLVKMMPENGVQEDDVLCDLLAFSTITYRANKDQSSGEGYDFKNYKSRLIQTHPLPAVRFYYLQRYYLKKIEEAKIFQDFEKIRKEAVSAAYEIEKSIASTEERTFVFMDTAHTEKALVWLSAVVSNLGRLKGELSSYSEIDYLGVPEPWERNYPNEDIWFNDDGSPIDL